MSSAPCALAVKLHVRHWCAMAREDPHFRLRIPESLKQQVEQAASDNHRSITSEIVARLERSFMSRDEITKLDLAEELRALRLRLERLDMDIERRATERKAARDKG